jgi:hypothetical protein
MPGYVVTGRGGRQSSRCLRTGVVAAGDGCAADGPGRQTPRSPLPGGLILVSPHGDGVRLHGMRPGCQTPSSGAKKLTPRYGAARPDGGRILPAVLAGDVCRQDGPMPEGLDHRGLRSWRQRRAREASWPGAGNRGRRLAWIILVQALSTRCLVPLAGLRVVGGCRGGGGYLGIGRVAAAVAGGGRVDAAGAGQGGWREPAVG